MLSYHTINQYALNYKSCATIPTKEPMKNSDQVNKCHILKGTFNNAGVYCLYHHEYLISDKRGRPNFIAPNKRIIDSVSELE